MEGREFTSLWYFARRSQASLYLQAVVREVTELKVGTYINWTWTICCRNHDGTYHPPPSQVQTFSPMSGHEEQMDHNAAAAGVDEEV